MSIQPSISLDPKSPFFRLWNVVAEAPAELRLQGLSFAYGVVGGFLCEELTRNGHNVFGAGAGGAGYSATAITRDRIIRSEGETLSYWPVGFATYAGTTVGLTARSLVANNGFGLAPAEKGLLATGVVTLACLLGRHFNHAETGPAPAN